MVHSFSEKNTLSEEFIKHDNKNGDAESGSSLEDIGVAKKQCVGMLECGDVCRFSDSIEDATTRLTSIRKLGIATILCLIFIAVEVAGGIFSNSLAILTDAAHLLSDVAGFAISLFAIWASGWEATPRQTYGFFRLEILGALVSIQLIWLLTGILVYEAIVRLIHTTKPIDGRLMFIVACFGFCVNIVMMLLLGHHHGHGHSHSHSHSHDHHDHSHDHDQDHHHDHRHESHDNSHESHDHDHGHDHHKHEHHGVDTSSESCLCIRDVESGKKNPCKDSNHSNINVHSAYLHVLGDLVQSIGVMIGGAIIWAKPSWKVVDLICTLLFSVIVLSTTIKMLRDIVEILMESTPREIDHAKLENGIQNISGVMAVHELHIWSITMGKPSLACHVTIQSDVDADIVLKKVLELCKNKFNISHVTVQIERS